MRILCIVNHTYQEQPFQAGQVYDLDASLGMRLMANYGPPAGQRDPKNPGPWKFDFGPALPAEPETELETEPDAVVEGGTTDAPVPLGMTKAELLAVAAIEGVEVTEKMTNAAITAAIQAARAAKKEQE